MLRTIYINTISELNKLDAKGINYKLNSFKTPGGRGIYWVDVELTDEQYKELEKEGICVW